MIEVVGPAARLAGRLLLGFGALLATGGVLFLMLADGYGREVNRVLRSVGNEMRVFGAIGELTVRVNDATRAATPLLAAAALVLPIALAALVLARPRFRAIQRSTVDTVAVLGAALLLVGVLAAVDYSRRQTVTGALPGAGSPAAVSLSYAAIATAAAQAGAIAVLVWMGMRAILSHDRSRSWITALVAAILAFGLAGVAAAQLLVAGFARIQDLYAGFYTATPDPRVAGQEVLALQARDLVLTTLGAVPLAAAAVGIPIALAAWALCRRSQPTTSG